MDALPHGSENGRGRSVLLVVPGPVHHLPRRLAQAHRRRIQPAQLHGHEQPRLRRRCACSLPVAQGCGCDDRPHRAHSRDSQPPGCEGSRQRLRRHLAGEGVRRARSHRPRCRNRHLHRLHPRVRRRLLPPAPQLCRPARQGGRGDARERARSLRDRLVRMGLREALHHR